MNKGRLEAFSDGVIAIIITIMVLELKPPHGESLSDFGPLLPALGCYILSFVFVGIYWNNHHHMLHAAERVNGPILWANLHLLFWLSLIPFATNWMGENHFSPWPVAVYGFVLLMAGTAYYILSRCLIWHHGQASKIARAVGSDVKGLVSLLLYAIAIPLAFVNRWISLGIYILVAVIWFIPDQRIEKVFAKESPDVPGK